MKGPFRLEKSNWDGPFRVSGNVLLLVGLMGRKENEMAVTVTYYTRGGSIANINGSVTPITAAAASQVMKQSAVVVFGTVDDTTALFTHNWGLDASAPTYFSPEVMFEPISTGTTSWPLITFWRANTNVLVVGKRAGDTATTVMVQIRRPHTIGQ
jgi:hypothetical protein